jgi:hypothetical protein
MPNGSGQSETAAGAGKSDVPKLIDAGSSRAHLDRTICKAQAKARGRVAHFTNQNKLGIVLRDAG